MKGGVVFFKMASRGPASVGQEGPITGWLQAGQTLQKLSTAYSHSYYFPSFCLIKAHLEEKIVEMLDIWLYADVKIMTKQI